MTHNAFSNPDVARVPADAVRLQGAVSHPEPPSAHTGQPMRLADLHSSLLENPYGGDLRS
jgi:hypothetical protein